MKYELIWEKKKRMIISERIFELLKQRGMTQKEFSEKTGIAQSTISDWKRKRTNPVAEKILIICEVLEITPEELLSGVEEAGRRNRPTVNFTISKESELGMLIVEYQKMDEDARKRLLTYMKGGQTPPREAAKLRRGSDPTSEKPENP